MKTSILKFFFKFKKLVATLYFLIVLKSLSFKAWEDRVNASGAADLTPKAQTAPATRPPQVKQQPSTRPVSP